jgi:hypothetical protein
MIGNRKMANDTLLTQNEAAEILRLSPRTLERHRVAGTGPKFMKAGARVLYAEDELRGWLTANTFQSTSEFSVAKQAT